MNWSELLPLAIPALILAFAVVARVASDLQTQGATRQTARVQQIEGTVSRVAAGLASSLMAAEAAGKTGDVLSALRAALADQGASYIQSAMPDTVAKAGATTASLTAMILGEADKQALAVQAGRAVLVQAGGGGGAGYSNFAVQVGQAGLAEVASMVAPVPVAPAADPAPVAPAT